MCKLGDFELSLVFFAERKQRFLHCSLGLTVTFLRCKLSAKGGKGNLSPPLFLEKRAASTENANFRQQECYGRWWFQKPPKNLDKIPFIFETTYVLIRKPRFLPPSIGVEGFDRKKTVQNYFHEELQGGGENFWKLPANTFGCWM